MESINRFGTPITFYIVSYNTDHNPVFGEDNDRRVERAFTFMGQPSALPEERQDMGFQIEGLDNFEIFISKEHFRYMSSRNLPSVDDESGLKFNDFSLNHITEDNGTGSIVWSEDFDNSIFSSQFQIGKPFNSYVPKVGDIIKLEFNEYLYEIKAVKEEDEMFHQHKHSWTIRVGKWINNHLNIDVNDFNDQSFIDTTIVDVREMESDLSSEIDELKDGTDVEVAKDSFPTSGKGKNDVLYDPKLTEKDSRFKDEGW